MKSKKVITLSLSDLKDLGLKKKKKKKIKIKNDGDTKRNLIIQVLILI